MRLAPGTARVLAAAFSAFALLAGAGSPAVAASPWTPYAAADFVAPAGERCAFELQGQVVSDKERIRTLETFPDGRPRVQQVVGQLLVRYTNTATAESVVRNLTGNGIVEYSADGSYTLTLQGGHFAVGLQPTDPGGPATGRSRTSARHSPADLASATPHRRAPGRARSRWLRRPGTCG